MLAQKIAAAGGNWWTAGGATGAIAAYQPKSAADYATSKVNLANPGTFDCTDGTSAPSWTSANGWSFNGSSFVKTGVTVTSSYTMLIQINTIGSGQATPCGVRAGGSSLFDIYCDYFGTLYFGNGGQFTYGTPFTSPGNIGLAGGGGIINGTSIASGSAGYSSTGDDVYIGGRNGNGSFDNGATFKCTAMGLWNNTLSSGQLTAVATAMAAL